MKYTPTKPPHKMKNKKTIFEDNQSLEDVVIQGVTFAIGSAVALLIATAFLTIILNLIY